MIFLQNNPKCYGVQPDTLDLVFRFILRLYTKFQCLNMPGPGQKVCSEWWWGGV